MRCADAAPPSRGGKSGIRLAAPRTDLSERSASYSQEPRLFRTDRVPRCLYRLADRQFRLDARRVDHRRDSARRHSRPHPRALQHQDPVLGLQATKTPWLRARRNPGLMPYAGIRKGPLLGRASVDPNSPLNGGDYTRSVGISQERTRNRSLFGCTQARQNRHRPQGRPELLSMAPRKHPDPAWRISPRTLQLVPAMSHGSPVRTELPPRKCRTRASGLPAASVDLPNTSGPERMSSRAGAGSPPANRRAPAAQRSTPHRLQGGRRPVPACRRNLGPMLRERILSPSCSSAARKSACAAAGRRDPAPLCLER